MTTYSGVTLGIALPSDTESEPGVAITMLNTKGTLAMVIGKESAAVIFNQLGDILDILGYFDDEIIEGENPCKLH